MTENEREMERQRVCGNGTDKRGAKGAWLVVCFARGANRWRKTLQKKHSSFRIGFLHKQLYMQAKYGKKRHKQTKNKLTFDKKGAVDFTHAPQRNIGGKF